MSDDATNEGDFSVIKAIGKAKGEPVEKAKPTPKPVTATTDDNAELEKLQRLYLWHCTFREIDLVRTISTDDLKLKGARYGESFSVSDGKLAEYIDSWKKQLAPSPTELITYNSGIAYTCANINAEGMLNARLRLYTYGGQSKTTLKTAKLDYMQRANLKKRNRIKSLYARQPVQLLTVQLPVQIGQKGANDQRFKPNGIVELT